MTVWELDIRTGWRVGLAVEAMLLLMMAGLIVIAVLQPVNLLTFIVSVLAVGALLAALMLAYWLWGLLNASYTMDRNAIAITWGNNRHQIPLASVREVLSGADLQNIRLRQGLYFPGHFVGTGEAEGLAPILFYAVAGAKQQIIVRTETLAYALSPTDLDGFREALEERRAMGPTQEVVEQSSHPAFLDWPIWQDHAALAALSGGGLLLLLLVGVLAWRYPALPPQIALRFTDEGAPLMLTEAARIFYLALIGLLFLILNSVLGLFLYTRERVAAYFLWIGNLFLQAALWVAVIAILLLQ